MAESTRRNFLKEAGVGAIAFSMGNGPLQAAAMTGGPLSGARGAERRTASSTMAIAAAPGDAFFAMGAPVALATHHGEKGTLLSLTLGEKGSATIPPEKYGREQVEASRKAAAMMGAEALFLHYPDGEVPINDEVKFSVCDLIRQYKPETIVTHWKGSWHKDHRACYQVVEDAIFYAALPGIIRKLPAHSVRELFFNDNWEDAAGFVPETYLDITPVFQTWMDACAVFPMWRGENGFRYNDYYNSLAIARGCVGNFKQAVTLMAPPEQRVRRLHGL